MLTFYNDFKLIKISVALSFIAFYSFVLGGGAFRPTNDTSDIMTDNINENKVSSKS